MQFEATTLIALTVKGCDPWQQDADLQATAAAVAVRKAGKNLTLGSSTPRSTRAVTEPHIRDREYAVRRGEQQKI